MRTYTTQIQEMNGEIAKNIIELSYEFDIDATIDTDGLVTLQGNGFGIWMLVTDMDLQNTESYEEFEEFELFELS